jgi:hypothetical protein
MGSSDGAFDEANDFDEQEENLYAQARRQRFGDWHYPVITAHTAPSRGWMRVEPDLLTTSANRNLIQPTKASAKKRKENVKEVVEQVKSKGKHRESSTSASGSGEEGRAPILKGLLRHHSSSGSSVKSDRSQLVDLVVEDTQAEEVEAVRARKEGSAGWNSVQPRRFV